MGFFTSSFGFQHAAPDGTYTFFVAQDVAGQYFVQDIRTPQGALRDNRALPESVIRAMAEALDLVQSGNLPVCDPSGSTGTTGTTGFIVL